LIASFDQFHGWLLKLPNDARSLQIHHRIGWAILMAMLQQTSGMTIILIPSNLASSISLWILNELGSACSNLSLNHCFVHEIRTSGNVIVEIVGIDCSFRAIVVKLKFW
jgi:hypothetical protein